MTCGGESNNETDEVRTKSFSDQSTTASPPSSPPPPPPLPDDINVGDGSGQFREGASTDCEEAYILPTSSFGRPSTRKHKRPLIHQDNNNFNSNTLGYVRTAAMAQQATGNMTVAKAAGDVVESVFRNIPLYKQLEVFNDIIALLRKEIRDERCQDSS